MPFKNTAQVVHILAWDIVNGTGKTGDSANFTIRGVGDGTLFTPSSPSITEIDSTNLKGVYSVALTAGENNYTNVLIGGKSSTAGIVIQPISWSNECDSNLTKIAGTSVSSSSAQLGVNVVNLGGNAVQASGGYIKVSEGSSTGQLDLTSGRPGIDWAKVSNPTTTLNLSATTVGVLTTYTGNTVQTGDSFARLGSPVLSSISADIAAIPALVWSYVTRTITSGGITVAQVWDYLTSSISTSGSIGKLLKDNVDATIGTRATPADVQTKVAAELDAAGTELSAIPSSTGTLRQKINFIFQYFGYKRTASNTTETLYKNDSSTTLGTSTISNTGTLFTKGKVS